MNFVENNGSKIAAVLCVASCFPVVATIYASGNQPGAQPENTVNGESKAAKGWQEIEGKSWFFKEDGAVEKEAPKTVAKVSTTISDNVSQSVVGTTKQYVEEINEEAVAAPVYEEEVVFEQLEPVQEEQVITQDTYVEETPVVVAPIEETFVEDAIMDEVVVEDETEVTIEDVLFEEPENMEVVIDDSEYEEAEEEYVEEAPVYEEETPVYEEVYEDTYQEEYIETPAPVDPVYDDYNYQATSTGQAIADAAMGLIGVTNGWQCTEVATQALINAGVQGVPVCWPDQYQYYGTVSYDASVGSLAYYYNGGRGVDHIAVYVGDGMCVHGNFDGQTVYYSETTADGSPDYYVVFE
ncbi:MAG: hypothetical protein KBT48_04950 [Firmicutes bacterium]|nr:hypothetical protein [Bacillota bacterium]